MRMFAGHKPCPYVRMTQRSSGNLNHRGHRSIQRKLGAVNLTENPL